MDIENAVEVRNLSKFFGAKKVLDDVTLDIPKGKVFGLLGPNGAGKTTLISVITGLLKIDSGSVRVLGLDSETSSFEIRKRINVMRGFTRAPRGMTGLQLMKYYMLLYDCWDEGKAKKLIESVGLASETGSVSKYSTGMRQRFYFAKALCNDPELLLLDEPTNGLDVDAALEVRKKLSELRESGKTILLTTHYLLEAEELCDEIALLNKGRIIARGTPESLKRMVKEREVVRVACKDAALIESVLKNIPGVKTTIVKKDFVEAVVESEKVLKNIMKLLSKSSLQVTGIELVEPPLEEAFMKLVKRRVK